MYQLHIKQVPNKPKITKNEKYIAYAIQTKLVVGYDGKLYLDSNVTRAETACLIYRAMSLAE